MLSIEQPYNNDIEQGQSIRFTGYPSMYRGKQAKVISKSRYMQDHYLLEFNNGHTTWAHISDMEGQ